MSSQETWSFPIAASNIMMFARAIGETDPAYYPARWEPGAALLAPPTFLASAFHFVPEFEYRGTYSLDASVAQRASSGDPQYSRRLHGEQHYDYRRPVRAGDVLFPFESAGASWEKETRRAGVVRFSERVTRWCDVDGDDVVVARSVSIAAAQDFQD